MDLEEISFIRKARRFLEKSARLPSCESPSKIPRHLVELLAIRKRIVNAGMKFILP